MISPQALKQLYPITAAAHTTVQDTRASLRRILRGEDKRLAVIVGPCSMHDPVAAREYAEQLAEFAPEVSDSLLLIMRTYLEKPRTSVGWRGFASDPKRDGSDDIESGLGIARELLITLNAAGIPCATETLRLGLGRAASSGRCRPAARLAPGSDRQP